MKRTEALSACQANKQTDRTEETDTETRLSCIMQTECNRRRWKFLTI